ncbi:carboxylesterase/lipase family protein [Lichenicoccus roseus]|uniref:carboxylesterase/lipase family protein n=1 Tax=Lichenicoccus roseus TaxID=2683649 RepID=UPI001981C77B|nr:carboxylesterase family protein [Lichenicoccus roseus]
MRKVAEDSRLWVLLPILLAVGLSGCASGPRGGSPTALVVATDRGAVQGAVVNGVENFLDIPYAAPPVGALRWAPPQPAAAWTGTRPAARSGAYCTQPKSLDAPNGPALDEDCLSINVQRPIGANAGARLPVYVYIHGGGFVTGSGVRDAQDAIVRANGIVGVSFNYRLGALGFLALPALAGPRGETGDYGLLDQQAALRWVRANIAAFGGDPDDVTIGGESAGGWSVCSQMVAPGSAGLFGRAIIESGSCVSKSLQTAEAAGSSFATRLGCTDPSKLAECLRGKPVADILDAQDKLYVPTRGTPFLPGDPREAVQSGQFSHVPVMIGSTRDEGRSFSQKLVGWSRAQYERAMHVAFGRNTPLVLHVYPYPVHDKDPAAVAYQLAAARTDSGALGADNIERGIGGCGNAALTTTLSQTVPTHAYEFAVRNGPGWYAIPGYAWGAGHAAELTYLYPQHDSGRTYAAFTPAERATSDEMVRRWGAFVSKADPNAPGLAAWPAYVPGQSVQSFGEAGHSVTLTNAQFRAEHRCAFWDRLAGQPVGAWPD